jgi:DNA-binding MarR family transcriptional regulator
MVAKLPEKTVAAWARLIRAEQALLDRVEADLKAEGLPPLVWYDVLLELRRSAEGRLRHRDLAARMLLAKHNLSRLVDRMAADGLLERLPVEDDGRGAHICLSRKGAELQRRMWPVYARSIARHFANRLDDDDIADLTRVLAKLA